jgi:hypothetical protein
MPEHIAADPDYYKYVFAVLTGFLGFAGSWFGAQLAFRSFKRERAFDKQLDWYCRAGASLRYFAQQIEIATTFEDEKGTSQELLEKLWRKVQRAHLEFDLLADEAGFFGSSAAVSLMERIREVAQNVANDTGAFDPPGMHGKQREAALEKIGDLPDKLREAHAPLVGEARRHLGIGSGA